LDLSTSCELSGPPVVIHIIIIKVIFEHFALDFSTVDSSTMSSNLSSHRSAATGMFLSLFSLIFIINIGVSIVNAGPVPLPFSFCAPSTVTEPNPSKRVNVTDVYGEIVLSNDDPPTTSLKITALAEIGDTLEGYSNQTGYLGQCTFCNRQSVFGSSALHFMAYNYHMLLCSALF
jgi:hypothetical protein